MAARTPEAVEAATGYGRFLRLSGLDKEKGQDDPLNRAILEVLEKLSELEAAENNEMEEVAIHASAIRNGFFDDKKKMEDVIPPVLLVTMTDRNEVPPRKRVAVAEERARRGAA